MPTDPPSSVHGEAFLRRLVDTLPVRIAYVDSTRRFRFVNHLLCERFGLPPEAILGRTRSELTSGSSDALIERHVDLVLAGQPQTFEFEELVDGKRCTTETRLVPDVDEAGHTRGFFATSLDSTEFSAAQRSLQRQSATLRSVTEAVPAIIFVVDTELRVRFVNGAFERWRGLAQEQIIGRTLQEVLGDEDYLRTRVWMQRALAGESVQFDREERGRSAAHLSNTYIPLRSDEGRVDGFVGVAQDITMHRLEQVRLLNLAERDPLTGLLNRAGFDERMAGMLSLRSRPPVALLFIDLDRFKPVNDQYGHPVGDQLLQRVADRLQNLVRPSDAVARLGGDEFAIVLSGMRERPHALAVAEKVLAAVCRPFELGAVTVEIGASVGVAWGRDDAAEICKRADAALYEAKRAGRGVVRCAPDALPRGMSDD
nr:diguanylate cyclase [Aquabacterium terrae]